MLVGVPGAYLIAIFRHGLWDMGLVIRKTVQYGVLVVAFMLLGFVIVGLVPTLLIGVGGTDYLPTVLIAAFLAGSFLWLRPRAARFANRLVYGRRATPYEVLSEFSERVGETYSTDDVLPRMAHLLVQATGARRADVWLRVGTELRCEARWPTDAEPPPSRLIRGDEIAGPHDDYLAEVRHQDELLGAITLDLPADDPMNPSKEALVRDLAAQAGLVLRNVRLIEELRASRQRLVAAQDEERRKLERNIHDGVQQQLVALTVQLRLAEQLTERDPAKARELMATLQGRTNEALEDLRDLARGIYPPLLADKGLATALEAQARKSPVPVTVRADGVTRYPQAVESAVYFSCLEALNNVAKYAEAEHVTITLARMDGSLAFDVTDDGHGFDVAATAHGTGLQGIADRLDALGGHAADRERGWNEARRCTAPSPQRRITSHERGTGSARWPWAFSVAAAIILGVAVSAHPLERHLRLVRRGRRHDGHRLWRRGWVPGHARAAQPDRLADARDRGLLRPRRRWRRIPRYTLRTSPGSLPFAAAIAWLSGFVFYGVLIPHPGHPVALPRRHVLSPRWRIVMPHS